MSGRYLTLVLLLSMVVLVSRITRTSRSLASATLVFLGLLNCYYPGLPITSSPRLDKPLAAHSYHMFADNYSINDEQSFYHFATNPLVTRTLSVAPNHSAVEAGLALMKGSENCVVRHTIGYFSYYAGPQKTIIDKFGLADPLIARLPRDAKDKNTPLAIGHISRQIPSDYIESCNAAKNLFTDPELRTYYANLLTITQGPPF